MEFVGILYSVGIGLSLFMLKGAKMEKGEGCQESFNIGLEEANAWWEKHVAGCERCLSRYQPAKSKAFGCNQEGPCSFKFLVASQCRYEPVEISTKPAKSTVSGLSRPNTQRYLKLYSGNVLDTKTNTIIHRHTLLEILDA